MKSEYNNVLAGNTKQPSPVTLHIDSGWLKYISSHNCNGYCSS